MSERPRRRTFAVVATAANAVATGILVASNSPFVMSGGSDAPNSIVAPGGAAQLVLVLMMVAISAVGVATSRRWRLVLAAVWVVLLGAVTHRVVVDVVRGEVRDVYCLISVQRLPLGAFEGEFATLLRDQGALAVRLATPRGESMTIWRGLPPARLDFGAVRF